MELADESTINKLILLYVFEAMDVAITGNTIIEMCTSRNTWLSYMDCTITINQLLDALRCFTRAFPPLCARK